MVKKSDSRPPLLDPGPAKNRSQKRSRDTETTKTPDKDCVPYWNNCTSEWSKRLLSCTGGIDLPDKTYRNYLLEEKRANSWFTVKSTDLRQPSNFIKSLPCLWKFVAEREQQKIETPEYQAKKKRKEDNSQAKKEHHLTRTRKIRLYPTSEEKLILNKWFGMARRSYNIAVQTQKLVKKRDKKTILGIKAEMIDNKGNQRSWYGALRVYIDKKASEKIGSFDPKKECQQSIRGHAVQQFFKATRSTKRAEAEASHRSESRKKAQFRFRSKKLDPQESIVIDARDWERKTGVLFSFFSKIKTPKNQNIPGFGELAQEAKVTRNKSGEYYFCVSNDMKEADLEEAPTNHHSTAALDPGVRTFQTIYDADGQGIEWGKDDMKKVLYLCRQADKLQSKISQRKTRRRGRAYHRILTRIKNQIKDCHYKLASFLCKNYKAILIPKFDTKRMIRRIDRKLNRKTVRGMCTWSHFTFRKILLEKAELFPWVKVAIVNEAYTSKTCGSCGHIHQNLGGNKTFCCPSCGNKADRDLHASRNILLRYLTREIGVVNDVFLNTSSSH